MRKWVILTTVCVLVGLLLPPAAAPAGPAATSSAAAASRPAFIPFRPPANTKEVTDVTGRRVVGFGYGNEANQVVVFGPGQARAEFSALAVDRKFARRDVKTLQQWQQVRQEIRAALMDYFGQAPAMDLPLDPKAEQEEDCGDYILRTVSIQFGGGHRSRLGLMIPKGLPAPGPALLIQDAWGNGVKAITGQTLPPEDVAVLLKSGNSYIGRPTYSRSIGVHLVRQGFIVVALEHWYDVYGKSSKLCTMGAAVHNIRRAVSYLQTQTDLINPAQIGLFGHIYGAEVAYFAAGVEDRLGAVVCSNSSLGPTAPYTAAFWSPPFWATGSAQGLGDATERASREQYCSNRDVSTDPLPFLTQELMALAAPTPLLTVNHGVGYGQKIGSGGVLDSILPVYELYGKSPPVEIVGHKLGSNLPPNARNHIAGFLLRAMCGIDPGRCPDQTVRQILDDLRSGQIERQLRACRLAAWWECSQAVPELAKLLTSGDVALRRAAAKALERAGAVPELFRHIEHQDPMVRMAAVEAIYLRGADPDTWKALAKLERDQDKWVKEAKWQCLQLSPFE